MEDAWSVTPPCPYPRCFLFYQDGRPSGVGSLLDCSFWYLIERWVLHDLQVSLHPFDLPTYDSSFMSLRDSRYDRPLLDTIIQQEPILYPTKGPFTLLVPRPPDLRTSRDGGKEGSVYRRPGLYGTHGLQRRHD